MNGSPDTPTTSETEASSLSGRGVVADRVFAAQVRTWNVAASLGLCSLGFRVKAVRGEQDVANRKAVAGHIRSLRAAL